MISKRKIAIGIAVLFALALSAFAAASASATGSTAFTWVKSESSGALFGSHCLVSSIGDTTKDSHTSISQDTTTATTKSNANTASGTTAAQSEILRSALSGVNTEITCKGVHGEGTLRNIVEGAEMYVHAEGHLNLTGYVVKAPGEKGCKVKGEANHGTADRQDRWGRRKGQKVAPSTQKKSHDDPGRRLQHRSAKQSVSGDGSFEVKTNGATMTSTHAEITTQNTLKWGGQKVGLDGALTFKAHAKAGEETIPIVATPTP